VIAVVGVVIGLVVVRVHGIFFIMITLALGSMAHAYFFESPRFGGDDGMGGIPRLDLSALGLDLQEPRTFALGLIALATLVYLGLAALLRSPFGHVLIGIRINEHRMQALGCPVARYKVGAFAVAAAIAGFAGTLGAQHTQFITPVLLDWTTSGEALIMLILGGIGTLIGPVIGATVVTMLRHELSSYTDYWSLFLGLFLIFVVLSGRNGIYGWLAWLPARMGLMSGGARERGRAAR
jgi:branched-chain amino acid transport system permease protein